MIDILAIGAHPDDVELSAAGTLLVHKNMGYKTAVVDLTRGELGTRGSAELRDKEAAKSAEILGLSERMNLELADGFFEESQESLLKLVGAIRHFRPKIVLANAVNDRHPDHARAASFISRACFLSGLQKIVTEMHGKHQLAHRPQAVYNFIQERYIKPDIIVDITPFFSQKMESVLAFGSQFYLAGSTEPNTPISGKEYLEFLDARARDFGRLINVQYGEGFTLQRPAGVADLMHLH